MTTYLNRTFGLSLLLLLILGCNNREKLYLYEVEEVEVKVPGTEKNAWKSDLEFLSLAYSDLYGTPIPNRELNGMIQAYNALGDKVLIADVLIRNMLDDPKVQIPTAQRMRDDPDGFVRESYKKFFVREPNEYERWFFVEMIAGDPELTPELLYYAFLTSDEYRYY